jgi:hypothetical protein
MTKRESSFSGDELSPTPPLRLTPKKSPAKKAKKETVDSSDQSMSGKGVLFKMIFEAGLKSFDKTEAATLVSRQDTLKLTARRACRLRRSPTRRHQDVTISVRSL